VNGFKLLGTTLRSQLRLGLSPAQLALALSLGACLGIMPVVWGTSLVCALAAYLLRLNQVLVQLANYIVYPVQILLFIPFGRWGSHWFGLRPLAFDLPQLQQQLTQHPLLFLQQCWQFNLCGLGCWLLSFPFLLLVCGLLLRVLLQWFLPSLPEKESLSLPQSGC